MCVTCKLGQCFEAPWYWNHYTSPIPGFADSSHILGPEFGCQHQRWTSSWAWAVTKKGSVEQTNPPREWHMHPTSVHPGWEKSPQLAACLSGRRRWHSETCRPLLWAWRRSNWRWAPSLACVLPRCRTACIPAKLHYDPLLVVRNRKSSPKSPLDMLECCCWEDCRHCNISVICPKNSFCLCSLLLPSTYLSSSSSFSLLFLFQENSFLNLGTTLGSCSWCHKYHGCLLLCT